MSKFKYGRFSPFRPPLNREDISVGKKKEPMAGPAELLLSEADSIGNSLMRRPNQESESPRRQYLLEKALRRSSYIEERPLSRPSDDEAQHRLQEIADLTEELNFNRKRYEKLLSDHAEEKRQWLMTIKQLEQERDLLP